MSRGKGGDVIEIKRTTKCDWTNNEAGVEWECSKKQCGRTNNEAGVEWEFSKKLAFPLWRGHCFVANKVLWRWRHTSDLYECLLLLVHSNVVHKHENTVGHTHKS